MQDGDFYRHYVLNCDHLYGPDRNEFRNLICLLSAVKYKLPLRNCNPTTSEAVRNVLNSNRNELSDIKHLDVRGVVSLPKEFGLLSGLKTLEVDVALGVNQFKIDAPDTLRSIVINGIDLDDVCVSGKGLGFVDLSSCKKLSKAEIREAIAMERLIVDKFFDCRGHIIDCCKTPFGVYCNS